MDLKNLAIRITIISGVVLIGCLTSVLIIYNVRFFGAFFENS